MINYKQYIKEKIEKCGFDLNNVEVVRPPKEDMGDFAIPCFTLKVDNVNNPNEKANIIKEKLECDDVISNIEVIGPYLNFIVNKELLGNEVINEINKSNNYGSSNIGNSKNLLIEHTSINPNASPHIGRCRNSIIGDFLVRLYKFEGYNVERHYFVNDIGKQISYLVVGTEKYGNIDTVTFKDILKLYVQINEEASSDENIEKQVFNYLNELENGNEEIRNKFKKITDLCVNGQREIFDKMDIHWDIFTHESDFVFGSTTKDILDKLKEKGKLKEDENGRLYVDLTGYDIPTKSPVLVLTREDKTSLYPLRDIAYTIYKINRNSDNNILILGEDQEVYFKQIEATLDILGYKAPQLISYDFVLLDGDKMSTREGKLVLLEDFIEASINKLKNTFNEKGSIVSDEVVSTLAASCIKYCMLNVNRKKTVNFNLESATDFGGNSAIYLLYNYVRINSILNKANFKDINIDKYVFNEEEEYSILNSLYDFPDVIDSAYKNSESVIICNYLYNLCGKFSKYYEKVSILKENDEMLKECRLVLLNCIKNVLASGMNILGIKTIDKF